MGPPAADAITLPPEMRRESSPSATKTRRALSVAAAMAVPVLLLLLDPVSALARAGGASGGNTGGGGGSGSVSHAGGGYSYGGGSSGYYGSSSTGGAPASPLVMVLGIGLIALVFGGFIYFASRSVRKQLRASGTPLMAAATATAAAPVLEPPAYPGGATTMTAPPSYEAGAIAAPADGVAAIKAVDPGFDEGRFLDRCQAAFFLLQKAWMDRNLDEGRAYMSAGLYQGWSVQVQQLIEQHRRDVLDGLYVEGMQIVRAQHDANFDTVAVRISARCADYIVDDRTGKKVSGSNKPEEWIEYWTFQRSAGTKTLVEGGITEKKCPNCGAPLSVNQNGACAYCQAPVTSGRFDWVLTRIDQPDQWR